MGTVMYSPQGLRRWARQLWWCVLAAIGLAVLAPAVSRALTANGSDLALGWVEVCTEQGMRRVPVAEMPETAADGRASDSSAWLDQCGHCTLASERFAPLAPCLDVLLGEQAPPSVPWRAPRVWRSRHAVDALARGPP